MIFLLPDLLTSSLCLIESNGEQYKTKYRHPQELDLEHLEDEDTTKLPVGRRSLNCDSSYRRIVKHLLDKNRFQPDPRSKNDYIGSVNFRVKKEQFDLLANDIFGLNLDEIDRVLEEIFKQSQDEKAWDDSVSQILFEHYRQQLLASLPTLDLPMILITITIVSIALFSRFGDFSRLTNSGLLLLVFLAICAISYTMTYRDCLHELEVEQMIQLSQKTSSNNPCKDYAREDESFWSSLKTSFVGSKENKCLEHMRKTFKSSKNYCDPLDVFAKWFAKIQMTYIIGILGSFLELLSEMTASSNFMSRIFFYVAGGAVFLFLFVTFGKDMLQHIVRGVFSAFLNTRVTAEQNASTDYTLLCSKMDEIISENQHMKRELSIIRECSVERSLQQEPALQQIEAGVKLENIHEED